jgi:heme-degrading monooxygenase HmoA
VITSDWESREAFTRFERSDEQDRLTAPLREMRESVRMTVYQLVAAL